MFYHSEFLNTCTYAFLLCMTCHSSNPLSDSSLLLFFIFSLCFLRSISPFLHCLLSTPLTPRLLSSSDSLLVNLLDHTLLINENNITLSFISFNPSFIHPT